MENIELAGDRINFLHLPSKAGQHRNYEVRLLPSRSGGGWRLYRLLDEAEADRVDFPLPRVNVEEILRWWDRLPDTERSKWWNVAKIPLPIYAWRAYQMHSIYLQADAAGKHWLRS